MYASMEEEGRRSAPHLTMPPPSVPAYSACLLSSGMGEWNTYYLLLPDSYMPFWRKILRTFLQGGTCACPSILGGCLPACSPCLPTCSACVLHTRSSSSPSPLHLPPSLPLSPVWHALPSMHASLEHANTALHIAVILSCLPSAWSLCCFFFCYSGRKGYTMPYMPSMCLYMSFSPAYSNSSE